MAKMTVVLDDDVYAGLTRRVPPRQRSRVINEAVRKELDRRQKQEAMANLARLRKVTGRLSGKEILNALRQDRGRRS